LPTAFALGFFALGAAGFFADLGFAGDLGLAGDFDFDALPAFAGLAAFAAGAGVAATGAGAGTGAGVAAGAGTGVDLLVFALAPLAGLAFEADFFDFDRKGVTCDRLAVLAMSYLYREDFSSFLYIIPDL
jgi:hypothetical protein